MPSAAESLAFSIVREVDEAEWMELIAQDSRARVFHEPWLLRVFERHLPGTRAMWMELRSAKGALCAGLPIAERQRGPWRAWSSGPSGSYGGPIVDVRAVEASAEELRSRLLGEYRRRNPWRVVRRELVYGHDAVPAAATLRCVESALLPTEVDFATFLSERFPKNRRNECSRSERRGLHVRPTRDSSLLAAFHPIYAERSHEWGAELVPLPVMQAMLERSEDVLLFVAEHEDAIVGGHLCVRAQHELFAWLGTTRRLEGTFPSSLLIREEARYACEHGLARLNLGSSLGLSGVLNYKRLLGADSRPLWILAEEALPLRLLRRLQRSN